MKFNIFENLFKIIHTHNYINTHNKTHTLPSLSSTNTIMRQHTFCALVNYQSTLHKFKTIILNLTPQEATNVVSYPQKQAPTKQSLPFPPPSKYTYTHHLCLYIIHTPRHTLVRNFSNGEQSDGGM